MTFQKGNKINLGRHHSDETKNKLSIFNLGRKLSEESKRKISNANKGKKPYQMTEAIRKKISLSLKKTGIKPPLMIGKIPWNKGKKGSKLTKEHKEKIRKAHKGKHSGENCHFWKGGICSKNELARKSIEYRLWREAVFTRDNWTCQKCYKVGGKLHSHHIKSFSNFTKLRFAIDNGITLCEECHTKTDNYGGKTSIRKSPLKEIFGGEPMPDNIFPDQAPDGTDKWGN
jgi:hypothetical protein